MKISFPSIKLKALNSRGVSHLLVPMLVVLTVAVGGTFMLVSSHAATPPRKCTVKIKTNCVRLATPASAGGPSVNASKPPVPTSKLLLYGGWGKWHGTKVLVAANSTTKVTTAAKCGIAAKGVITKFYKKNTFGFGAAKVDTKNVVSYSPTSIVCNDPPTGGEFRIIYSGTVDPAKRKFTGLPVVVSAQQKQCLFIHYSGKKADGTPYSGANPARNVQYVGGKCIDLKTTPPTPAGTTTPAVTGAPQAEITPETTASGGDVPPTPAELAVNP